MKNSDRKVAGSADEALMLSYAIQFTEQEALKYFVDLHEKAFWSYHIQQIHPSLLQNNPPPNIKWANMNMLSC